MTVNLAIVFLLSMALAWVFEKLRLPGLLGMLCAGVILGPYCLDFMAPELLAVSSELRTAALIVILIRAGLGISKKTLNRVGPAALRMSFIPCCIEGVFVLVTARFMLGLGWAEAGMLGFIIAAVSPAVVVPQMLELKEKSFGANREVPTLILAGASLDDVFAITLFYIFLNLGTGQNSSIALELGRVPLSIVLGVAGGLLTGLLLLWLFRRVHMRDTRKVLMFLMVAILFHHLETLKWPVAGFLGIMAMGFAILEKREDIAHRLAAKFGKVWVFAELLLFVLIGAQVNINVAWNAGLVGIVIILSGLIGRSAGVSLALLKSGLNGRERLFCMIAYIPKATVQAAIGAIPLAAGVSGGEVILAVAVLSIIITAPTGAVLIRTSAPRLLD